MSEMVERVARAIWWDDNGRNPLDAQPDLVQQEFRRRAVVAIAATREPTEAMVHAGFVDKPNVSFADIWRAMNDAALAD